MNNLNEALNRVLAPLEAVSCWNLETNCDVHSSHRVADEAP